MWSARPPANLLRQAIKAGAFQDVEVIRRLGKIDGQYQRALLAGAGLERFERRTVGADIFVDNCAKRGLRQVLHLCASLRPAFKSLACRGRKVPGEAQIRIVSKNGVTAMKCASQPGAIVAAPVQQVVDIHNAIARCKFHRNTIRQRNSPILKQLAIFRVRIAAAMTAGYHPKHAIIVERDVPLQIPGGRSRACPFAALAAAPCQWGGHHGASALDRDRVSDCT